MVGLRADCSFIPQTHWKNKYRHRGRAHTLCDCAELVCVGCAYTWRSFRVDLCGRLTVLIWGRARASVSALARPDTPRSARSARSPMGPGSQILNQASLSRVLRWGYTVVTRPSRLSILYYVVYTSKLVNHSVCKYSWHMMIRFCTLLFIESRVWQLGVKVLRDHLDVLQRVLIQIQSSLSMSCSLRS